MDTRNSDRFLEMPMSCCECRSRLDVRERLTLDFVKCKDCKLYIDDYHQKLTAVYNFNGRLPYDMEDYALGYNETGDFMTGSRSYYVTDFSQGFDDFNFEIESYSIFKLQVSSFEGAKELLKKYAKDNKLDVVLSIEGYTYRFKVENDEIVRIS